MNYTVQFISVQVMLGAWAADEQALRRGPGDQMVAKDGKVMMASRARGSSTRERILAAALTCFVRDGYEVAVDAIAAQAGVSKITLYRHFGEKRELFSQTIRAVLDEGASVLAAALRRLAQDPEHLRHNLVRCGDEVLRHICDPDRLRLRVVVQYQSREFPELARQWQERGLDSGHLAAAEAFRRLVDAGFLQIPDVPLAVAQFSSLILGPFMLSVRVVLPPAEERRKVVESGVDVFLRSYAPR